MRSSGCSTTSISRPCGADEVRGTRVGAQGRRHGVRFGVEAHVSPGGRRFLWVKGGSQQARCDASSDVEAAMDGYVAVTPIRPDLTCHASLGGLQDVLNDG